MTGTPNFKIVPLVEKPAGEKVIDLKLFLSSNKDVAMAGQQYEKVAVFQQHLDLLDQLVEASRDRIEF